MRVGSRSQGGHSGPAYVGWGILKIRDILAMVMRYQEIKKWDCTGEKSDA